MTSARSSTYRYRVLHLVETLQVGGTETQAVEIALRQAAACNDVVVACLAGGPLLTLLQRAGISVIELRKGRRLFSLRGLWHLLRLALVLRHRRFDVVHCHDLMSNLLGVPAAILARTPVVISSRRYLDLEWWQGNWRTRITAWAYKLSNYVVVNSTAIADLLIQRDGIPREKIRVLYNGIDPSRFRKVIRKSELSAARNESMIIAVVANMYSPAKGHAHLIAAAIEVCKAFPKVIFALIGDGKERPKLEQQVRDAGLEKNILFLGSRRDIPELLACCDLSVLPSESEGFPNAILEAMAAGVAVVATAVGGVPEIIEDEVTGLLVPPANPSLLCAAILRLLNDHELRRRISRAGRDHVAFYFSFGRLMGSLEALYTGLHKATSGLLEQRQDSDSFAAAPSFAHQPSE